MISHLRNIKGLIVVLAEFAGGSLALDNCQYPRSSDRLRPTTWPVLGGITLNLDRKTLSRVGGIAQYNCNNKGRE
jgi:hypothetical protein